MPLAGANQSFIAILHHHTMKLLQAFESFLPGRPIVEIGSKN
jgi:hypothetical protein